MTKANPIGVVLEHTVASEDLRRAPLDQSTDLVAFIGRQLTAVEFEEA
jgi:hypothetical protein